MSDWVYWFTLHGKDNKFYEHIKEKFGHYPVGVPEPPDLEDADVPFIAAYYELLDSQTTSGVLPYVEIEAYCRLYEIQEVRQFARIMRACHRGRVCAKVEKTGGTQSSDESNQTAHIRV